MVKKSCLLIIAFLILAVFSDILFAQTVEEYCLRADVLYFNKGDSVAALESLKKALEIDPTHTPSLSLYQLISEKSKEQVQGDEFPPETEVVEEETKEKKAEEEKAEGEEREEAEEEKAKEEIEKEEEKEKIELAKEVPSMVSSQEGLSLSDCLVMAIKSDPGLLRQQREIEISYHRMSEEKARQWPSLKLNLSYAPGSEELKSNGPWIDTNQDYNALLSLDYEIYPRAISSIRTRQARVAVSIEENRWKQARETVIDDVTVAFYTILEREEAVRITKETILNIGEHLTNVQKKYDLGSAPEIELLRTKDELYSSEEDLRAIQLALKTDRLKLLRLIGYELDKELKIADSQVPQRIETLKECIGEAIKRKPELERIKDNLEYAKYEESINRLDRHPTLSFSADYGLIGEDFPPDREAYYLRALLSVPLFNGGIQKQRIEQQKERIAEREIELRQAETMIEEEVRAVYLRYMDSLDRLEIMKKEIEQRKRNLILTMVRYNVELETYSDVISAIRSSEGAEKRWTAMKYKLELNKLRLIKAMGLDPLKYIEDSR